MNTKKLINKGISLGSKVAGAAGADVAMQKIKVLEDKPLIKKAAGFILGAVASEMFPGIIGDVAEGFAIESGKQALGTAVPKLGINGSESELNGVYDQVLNNINDDDDNDPMNGDDDALNGEDYDEVSGDDEDF